MWYCTFQGCQSQAQLFKTSQMCKRKTAKNVELDWGLHICLDNLYLINFGFVSRQIWTLDLNKKTGHAQHLLLWKIVLWCVTNSALFPVYRAWVESLGMRLSQLPATLERKCIPHNTGLTWSTILMSTMPLMMDFVAPANVVLSSASVTCSEYRLSCYLYQANDLEAMGQYNKQL